MPIYEYRCDECGRKSSALLASYATPDPPCPHCGKPALKRLVSTFATVSSGDGDGGDDFDSDGGGDDFGGGGSSDFGGGGSSDFGGGGSSDFGGDDDFGGGGGDFGGDDF